MRELEGLRFRAQEADIFEKRLKIADNEKNKLNEIVIEKLRENDSLKSKASTIPHLEGRVEVVEKDRESLRQFLFG